MLRPAKKLIKITATVVAAAACATAVAGCSDDGPGGDAEGLLGALERVTLTDSTRSYIEYGHPARVAQLVEQEGDRFLTSRASGSAIWRPPRCRSPRRSAWTRGRWTRP